MPKLTIEVDLGNTGLTAGDAMAAIANEMIRLKEILYAQDDQDAIPMLNEIENRDGELIGRWERWRGRSAKV